MRPAKQWRSSGVVAAVLAVLFGCAGSPDQADSAPATAIDEPGVPKQLQARQIIVALPDRSRPDWPAISRDLQTQYRLRPVGEFPLTSIGVQCLVFQVPADQSMAGVIGRLNADPRVVLVQPNQSFEGLQGGASNPYRELAYGAKQLRADLAHRASTGRDVAVAVIDTGADTDHPDLRGQIAQIATFVEGGEPSFRSDRHGTAVAGVIGARAGGGNEGIAPGARLTVLKACWYSDPAASKARCSSWTLAKAVDHAITHRLKVLNLSLGGPTDDLLARLLAAAERNGIIVVVATLDNPHDPGFPASLDTVIPAVACDVNGRIAAPRWSGLSFAAVAPGVEVVALSPNASYTLMSGSSLAAAHVTGVVALLLQQNPQATPDQIRTVLRATARPVAGSTPAGVPRLGLLDACAALARQNPTLVCP
ncbi:MAG: S8 family serine peptidase [Candidatus Competibacteraceae bacterium]|nr:S8 family serine peptidase [Candidatus Competibacteraceae bacterium]MBK8899017.1 S8 family serine peptidase [Candidatus Competibacteraceae bacterium]MBK8963059.1 S8 family serine peptidase [Candidatus Competibacteraceae bacterium]